MASKIPAPASQSPAPASWLVWIVCNDLSPHRATVVAIYDRGADADRHMARAGGATHACWYVHRNEGVKVGDRVWRRV